MKIRILPYIVPKEHEQEKTLLRKSYPLLYIDGIQSIMTKLEILEGEKTDDYRTS